MGKCGGGGCREAGGKVQLDGAWSFKAQLNALGSVNQEEDFSFRQNSVKEVTDRGRAEGISRLQKVLQESAPALPTTSKKRKALPAGNEDDQKIAKAMDAAEAELRKNVLALLTPLRDLEQVAGQPESDTAVLAIFRQLRRLNITTDCLKATRVALELNKPCWRGSKAAAPVRDAATSLIKSWRNMYRAEHGQSSESEEAARARQLRLLAVDLEDKVFNQCHKMDHYCRAIESLSQDLGSQDLCQSLVQGRTSGQVLVSKTMGLPLRSEGASQVHVLD